ncbi:hypothetical protein Moror_9286 [Moniliophthora roreri MCA 2997]|uniref:Uncharacterized protein n=1 Tax=Moniliophthora roreri (strain MCA 2997) TaxID=1381753 RepID=V2WH52_MONRO|nr:hypothetical protein Moror_9286 [Moniliophthora roreri MCA 2997]
MPKPNLTTIIQQRLRVDQEEMVATSSGIAELEVAAMVTVVLIVTLAVEAVFAGILAVAEIVTDGVVEIVRAEEDEWIGTLPVEEAHH